jgi:Acetyltransferase (GNAT) family.
MKQFNFIGEKFSNRYVYTEVLECEDFIRLEKIRVNKKYRNLGYGTLTINKIIEYADKKNKILVLCAEPQDKKWSLKRLMNFYKRFGFIENEGANYIDIFWNDNMYRLPSKRR